MAKSKKTFLNHPGVYIEELRTTPTITGSETSVTAFIEFGKPRHFFPCTSFKDFEIMPGTDANSALGLSVRLFFENGGSKCFVVQAPVADHQALNDIITQPFNLMVILIEEESVEIIAVLRSVSEFCFQKRAMLLLNPLPQWSSVNDVVRGVESIRHHVRAENCAIFFPRVFAIDNNQPVGPAGAIAGLIAQTDSTKGVWKSPAGLNAILKGVDRLEYQLNDNEISVLNPKGINAIREKDGVVMNWGARTLAGDDQLSSEWKYLAVRRLFLYLEQSIDSGLDWVVFEPNGEPLWTKVRMLVENFLLGLFRQGAFQGITTKEAYFVRCDRSTMTQQDLALGRMIVEVGFAPVKPAEFIVLRIMKQVSKS